MTFLGHHLPGFTVISIECVKKGVKLGVFITPIFNQKSGIDNFTILPPTQLKISPKGVPVIQVKNSPIQQKIDGISIYGCSPLTEETNETMFGLLVCFGVPKFG